MLHPQTPKNPTPADTFEDLTFVVIFFAVFVGLPLAVVIGFAVFIGAVSF